MNKLGINIVYTLALLVSLQPSSFAQTLEPVKWTFEIEQNAENDVTFSANASIAENWNVYSLNMDSRGPIATSIAFENMENLVLNGKLEESGNAKTQMDEIFRFELKKFKNNASFTQKFKKSDGVEGRLLGFVTFMCCNDKHCLPPTEVAFDLKVE